MTAWFHQERARCSERARRRCRCPWGAHPSWTATPVSQEHSGGVHGLPPRLSCTVISTYLPVEAECTHRNPDATRNDVSSAKCCAHLRVAQHLTRPVKPGEPGSGPRGHRDRPGQTGCQAPVRPARAVQSLDGNAPGYKWCSDRRGVRPVLHRRRHPFGRLGRGEGPAPAPAFDQHVLGHRHPDRRGYQAPAAAPHRPRAFPPDRSHSPGNARAHTSTRKPGSATWNNVRPPTSLPPDFPALAPQRLGP